MFFNFSQSDLRDATGHSALQYFTLSVNAWKDPRRHWPLTQLPLSTCEDNCPFSQKATPIYLKKSGAKFPADRRIINFFYQAENLKFVGTKKSIGLISLGHEVKTRLSGGQGLSSSDLTSQGKEKLFFLFFFFIGLAHSLIRTHTHTYSHSLLVQLHI